MIKVPSTFTMLTASFHRTVQEADGLAASLKVVST